MPRSAQTLNLEAVLQAGITPDSLFDYVLPNPYPSLPPIVDFALRTDNSGLALQDMLYPRQKTLLRLMFLETDEMTAYDVDVIEKWRNQFYSGHDRIGLPPDIWERIDWCINNGYDHFREVIFIGGRRGGKGHLGAIVGARQMYRLIRMNVPQAVYGISHDKELMLFVTATNFTQARDNQFKDLHDLVGRAPAFDRWRGSMKNYRIRLRTPYDEQRIMMLRGWGARIDSEIASIQAMAISANSKAARGFASFGNFYDEMAHMQTGTLGPRTAEEVYQALTPALDQMGPGGRDSIIYVPTSPYCLVPDTKVLTDDLRWVPVGNLAVGDGVLGFDENIPGGRGKGRSWRKAVVTETSVIQAPRVTLKTTGPSITCTPDHRWLVLRDGPWNTYQWVRTADLQPGDRIGDIGTWETDESRGAGYLAGFFDSEGHISKQASHVGACQNPGLVLDEVLRLVNERGFDYWMLSKRKHDDTINLGIQGGIAEQMRFLGAMRPHRLIPRFIETLEGKRIYGRKTRPGVEVISVEEEEVGEVVALGTSTKTLMAEGLFSHNTQIGQAYALYEDALAVDADTGAPTNPDMLVIQLPSWDPYQDWDDLEATQGHQFYGAPSLYNDGMKRIERRDKARFRVERKSQWAAQIDAYLDPIMVDQIFAPFDGKVLEMQPHGILAHAYRAHIDPGKSQANFAFTIGHTEPVVEHDVDENGKTVEKVWHHVFIDHMQVWRPGDFEMNPEDMEYVEDPESGVWHPMMDYIVIKDEIVRWMAKFPTTYVLSVDNYGAFATLPDLRRAMRKMHHAARVKEEAFNPRQNQIRAERFKTALGMGWVHAPRDTFHGDNDESLLEKEAKFVQEKPPGSGKLVPPTTGEVRTKDLLDTVMVVTTELLADQLERLERRENLADARIAMGAQGGYNTKMEPEQAIQAAAASGRRANPRSIMEQHRRGGVTRSNPYGGRRR